MELQTLFKREGTVDPVITEKQMRETIQISLNQISGASFVPMRKQAKRLP
jgi:hypothetical protein